MQRQWLNIHFHGVDGIFFFNQSTRTNNDCEGWHLRLRLNAKRNHLGVYQLIGLIHKEAEQTVITVSMLHLSKDARIQKKRYRTNNIQLMILFNSYINNNISADVLLKHGAHLISPRDDIMNIKNQ